MVMRHLDTLMSEREINNEIENKDDIQDKPVTPCQKCTKLRLITGLLLVGFIIFIVVDSTNNQHIKNLVEDFLDWVENNPVAGFFAFTGVYFIATILLIPGSILTLGSGFIFAKAFGLAWGVLIATLAVFFGASLGYVVVLLRVCLVFVHSISSRSYKHIVCNLIYYLCSALPERMFEIYHLTHHIPFFSSLLLS